MKRPRVPVLSVSFEVIKLSSSSPLCRSQRDEEHSQGLVPLDLPGLLALDNDLVLGRGVEADVGQPRGPGARDLGDVEVVLDEVDPALAARLLLARVVVLVVPVSELVLADCGLANMKDRASLTADGGSSQCQHLAPLP